ncbi:MAG: 4-hydroxy-tetrahydrodipicolinate synthase [Propionibacteriaceae bacterium]|nr:4-hydroxy-tetrahydrodipicolinate synthase [Propionibacteriaceae bacterium]
MREPIFRGAATALVTPFTPTGEVNYPKLGELLDYQIDQGIDAVVILGTTGESPTLPTDEHIDVIARAVDMVAGRIPVIAGAGSNSTAEAVDQTRRSSEVGADAILSVTPYYNKTSQAGLVAHFRAIADATDLPIIMYNVPSRTGLNITPETAAELSQVDNIVGIKECNMEQVGAMKRLVPEDFQFYSGEDGQVIPMLAWGGSGVISVMSNVIPATTHDLVWHWLNGEHDRARELQLSVIPLIKALFAEVNPIPVKEALNILGFEVGQPRLPLVGPSEATRQALTDALREYGVPLRSTN